MGISLLSKTIRLFCISCILMLTASGIASAQERINLKMQDTALEKILDGIEQQSKYIFICDKIDLSQKMNVNIDNIPVEPALKQIFRGTGITWKITGTNIYLSPGKTTGAQGGKVSGTIVDATGFPLMGAAVLIKGSTTGATTDIDGKFAFELPSDLGGRTQSLNSPVWDTHPRKSSSVTGGFST